MIYNLTSVLLLIIILYVLYRQSLKDNLHSLLYPSLFGIRVLAGCFFLYVYTYIYGGGFLTHDASEFLRESKILNELFYSSPKSYFTFLFGLEPSEEYVRQYLENTSHWSAHGKAILNDSQNVIRVNSLIYFISGGNTFTHILIGALISFLGIKETASWVRTRSSLKPTHIFIFLSIIPSLLFWSSSFLKEPFMILGFALILRSFFDNNLPLSRKWWRIIIGIGLSIMFKPYVLILLIPALFFFLLYTSIFKKKKLIKSILFLALTTILISCIPSIQSTVVNKITRQQTNFINVGAGGLHIARNDSILFFTESYARGIQIKGKQVFITEDTPGFYVTNNLRYTVEPFLANKDKSPWQLLYKSEGSASHFEIPRLNYRTTKMISTAPEAIMNSFFRPFWNDSGSWLMSLAKLENILFLCTSFFLLFKGCFNTNNPNLGVIISMIIFIFLLMLVIGYTTPVSGAIVRYKIPAQLAFGILFILAFNKKQSP